MAIDYNADVLPLYNTKLEGSPEYVQELASVSTREFSTRDADVVGLAAETAIINGVTVTVTGDLNTNADSSLDAWLSDFNASALAADIDFNIVQENNGNFVIVMVAIDDGSPVDIDITGGTGLSSLGLSIDLIKSGGDLQTGRADQMNEQRLLTTLGVLVSHLRVLGSRVESRALLHILSRISTGVGSGGFVYSDLSTSVCGNVRNPAFVVNDQINIKIVNPWTGAINAFQTTPAGPGFDMDDLVAAINTDAGNAGLSTNGLEAFNDGGRLKFVSEGGLNIEVQSGVGNDLAASKSGLEFGISRSKRVEVAEKVKADALDYFDTSRRALNL